MCSVSKCMVLAINTDLNQLSYFIFSRKVNLTEIKHIHDWWNHFYSKVIEHARKKLLKLKLHGRPFILAFSSCLPPACSICQPLSVLTGLVLTTWVIRDKIYLLILCQGASPTCGICRKMVPLDSCNSGILQFWKVLLGVFCPTPGLV